jgi:hypothetical protein
MRQTDSCPVCGGRAGRLERRVEDGEVVQVYWHTDLENHKEFCVEYPDGTRKQVFQGQGEPTGPRA